VAVERRELPPPQQIAALRAGEIDVGFLGVPAEARQRAAGGAARGDAQLAFVPVMRTAWAVALPAAHPLARPPLVGASTASDATPRAAADRGRPAIPVAAYAAEPLVLFPRNMNPGLYDWTLDCVRRAGAGAPRVVQEPAQLHTALGLVAAGVGVMPTPFHLADQRRPGVAVRPTSGFGPGARICAVYRRDHQTAVLTAFLEAVRDTARELRPDHNGSGQRRPEVQTGRS
jgi:DNA-binding transcriptional LysR family regulator